MIAISRFLARWIFFTGLFLCQLSLGKAQKFQAGFVLGLNTSQISGDDLGGFNKLSPNAGFYVSRNLNKRFSWQLEMTYLGKGSKKLLRPSDSIPTFYLLRLHYIEVPLILQYQLKDRLSVETGPSIGVFIGHYEEDINGILDGAYSPREQFKRFDLSGNIGVTYKLNINWSFNLRGSNSILPVRNYDQQTKLRLTRGQLNKSIMFRLTYLFNS